MHRLYSRHRKGSAASALLLAFTIVTAAPLVGCSSGEAEYPPPAGNPPAGTYDYGPGSDQTSQAPAAREGMSTKKKLVLLAGAAAAYYLYKKHQNAQAQHGPEGQYYLSKNGRIYYRDEQGRPHWVTPPPQGIEVPEHEAYAFQNMQGYAGQPQGMDMQDVYRMETGGGAGGGPGR